MLQEIVTKERIFKIYQNAQPKLIAQLKKEESLVAYRFINRLLGELLEFRIEEKSQGYEEITEKMLALHSKNLEMYLYDVKLYGKELEKRDMEISKLMFKMQTDLEKEGE
jgi:Na+/phosphate symporter